MSPDGYPKRFSYEQFLAAIYGQLDSADEGWISVNGMARELGMDPQHARINLDLLRSWGVIQVIETKRGVGTHVRISGEERA